MSSQLGLEAGVPDVPTDNTPIKELQDKLTEANAYIQQLCEEVIQSAYITDEHGEDASDVKYDIYEGIWYAGGPDLSNNLELNAVLIDNFVQELKIEWLRGMTDEANTVEIEERKKDQIENLQKAVALQARFLEARPMLEKWHAAKDRRNRQIEQLTKTLLDGVTTLDG